MKTKNFWSFIAAAVIMTVGMVFVSCGDENNDEDLGTPKILVSSVEASGADENIVSTPLQGTDGTLGARLSYQSWIVVSGQTRSAFENKITVDLTDTFAPVSSVQSVTDFDFRISEVSSSRKELARKTTQAYVTVIDSALVYSFAYANGLKLSYELVYQVPIYDDGITKVTMPYYQIEAVEDKGLVSEDLSDIEEDGKVWKRKLCNHAIEVRLNGQRFNVSSKVEARSEQQEDVLQSSIVADEGYELVGYDANTCEGEFKSWLEIRQNWSLGGAKSVRKEVILKHRVGFPNSTSMLQMQTKYTKWDDLSVSAYSNERELESESQDDNVTFKTFKQGNSIKVSKEDDSNFRVDSYVELVSDEAVYDDGKLSHKFPSPQFSEIGTAVSLSQDWQEQGMGYIAKIKLQLGVEYGQISYTCSIDYPLMYVVR